MNLKLYNWLEKEFYKSNTSKYHKYFKEWINSIQDNQIDGFHNQMVGQITKNKQL